MQKVIAEDNFLVFFGGKTFGQKFARTKFLPSKASPVLARQTPKTPRALLLLRRMRGVDEPGAVRPNIYASKRLARTQARLPLGCFSTLATLQGCGRWAAELLKGFISKASLEIGSDLLVKGPFFQLLIIGKKSLAAESEQEPKLISCL